MQPQSRSNQKRKVLKERHISL